jgi:integrase/recombinase XerD
MSPLRQALGDYLSLRRGLGFKLSRNETRLRQFLTFLSRRKAERITNKLALQFATANARLTQRTMAMRLSAVRGFARYLAADDPHTEVPPCDLLPGKSTRATPYLYSEKEIARLLRAARAYPTWNRFPGPWWHRCQGWSWYCFFALLAATGMRVSEVRNLRDDDVDWKEGVLTIRQAKFAKSRLVPLHPTMLRALRTFVRHRDQFFERVRPDLKPQRLFVGSYGTPVAITTPGHVFLRISRKIGLRGEKQRRGPRIHDLRHRFAVDTLVRWYRGGQDVDRLLPVLSTYLGHTHVSGTYWYLRCTPELMAAAADRLERRWEGVQ